MTETAKAGWPTVCKYCGAGNPKYGKTEDWEWVQFDCGTEFEAEDGELGWNQDDECRIAQLEAQLAEAEKERDEAKANHDAGREFIRTAWDEMNRIRARDGAPAGVDHDYWSEIVEQIRSLLTGDEASPWMTRAAKELVRPFREKIAQLEASAHLCPDCGASCKDCPCYEKKLAAAEEEAGRLREAAKQACIAGRALPHMVRMREFAEPGGPEWTRWDNSIEFVFNGLSRIVGDVPEELLAPQREEGSDE